MLTLLLVPYYLPYDATNLSSLKYFLFSWILLLFHTALQETDNFSMAGIIFGGNKKPLKILFFLRPGIMRPKIILDAEK
jgi:hypothetical protein